jgi:hypothetical protein
MLSKVQAAPSQYYPLTAELQDVQIQEIQLPVMQLLSTVQAFPSQYYPI